MAMHNIIIEKNIALADWLDQLANRINRNGLSRVKPEDFHAEKSDMAHEARLMAKVARGDTRKTPTTTWRPKPRV